MAFLARSQVVADLGRVAIWGAPPSIEQLLAFLRAAGAPPVIVVDKKAEREPFSIGETAVKPPHSLVDTPWDTLLVGSINSEEAIVSELFNIIGREHRKRIVSVSHPGSIVRYFEPKVARVLEPLAECPLCRHPREEFDVVSRSIRKVLEEGKRLELFLDMASHMAICQHCGLIFDSERPNDEFLDDFVGYRYWHDPVGFDIQGLAEVKWDRRLRQLQEAIGTGFRAESVLEVGSATGYQLSMMKEQFGCQVTGIEPVISFADYSENRYPNLRGRIIPTRAEKVRLPNDQFDLVMIGFTLRHFQAPRIFLNAIGKSMKSGGILILDESGFVDELGVMPREDQCKYFYQEKKCYYMSQHIPLLFARHGFYPVKRFSYLNLLSGALFVPQSGFIFKYQPEAIDHSPIPELPELRSWATLALQYWHQLIERNLGVPQAVLAPSQDNGSLGWWI